LTLNKRLSALVLCVLAFANSPAIAADASGAPEKYAGVAAIPEQLRQTLISGVGRGGSHYVAFARQTISAIAGDHAAITEEDIRRLDAQHKEERRQRQVEKFMQGYDRDGDGRATEQEIKAVLQPPGGAEEGKNAADYYKNLLIRVLALDKDKDGVISLAEAREIPLPKERPRDMPRGIHSAYYYAALLALDPNADERLTADEMAELVRRAFDTADADGDGNLSDQENDALVRLQKQAEDSRSPCAVSPPSPDARIVYLGTYGAAGLSQFTVAGQLAMTGVVPVGIEPDAGKIHVIVASMEPTIWAFSGATAQVSGVMVFGPQRLRYVQTKADVDDERIAAGVTGIAPAQVDFRDSINCLPGDFSGTEYRGEKAVRDGLLALFGREPDIMAGHNDMRQARISRRSIFFVPDPDYSELDTFDPPVPAGFDASLWTEAVLNNSDRTLHDLSQAQIVSEVTPEMYKVLPGWPGLARLVQEGAIIREGATKSRTRVLNRANRLGPMMAHEIDGGGTFKIVREIPYLPANVLNGPAYILGKGITLPKADGNTCITSETTGEVLVGGFGCKPRSLAK